jgi:hypothetical protein
MCGSGGSGSGLAINLDADPDEGSKKNKLCNNEGKLSACRRDGLERRQLEERLGDQHEGQELGAGDHAQGIELFPDSILLEGIVCHGHPDNDYGSNDARQRRGRQ